MKYLLNFVPLVPAALPDVEHDVAREGGSLALILAVGVSYKLRRNQALALLIDEKGFMPH